MQRGATHVPATDHVADRPLGKFERSFLVHFDTVRMVRHSDALTAKLRAYRERQAQEFLAPCDQEVGPRPAPNRHHWQVALAVIGDVLKTEVYQLARHLNRNSEIIPRSIIEKRPSAELAPGQFDDQSLPPYDKLDPILRLYFEQRAIPKEIIATGAEPQLVYDILNRVESPANEFKRRQLPPTLIISRNAIGIGRRRPVTHHYRRERLDCG